MHIENTNEKINILTFPLLEVSKETRKPKWIITNVEVKEIH